MQKSQITESVLVESRSARNSQISDVTDDRALETLNKAKALVMALWNSKEVATSAQLAEYFEISEDVVRDNVRRNKEEFESDGLKILRGKQVKDLLAIGSEWLSLPKSTTVLTVWTPRAALRLGMLLKDSPVAKQVRSVILDIVETASPKKSIRGQILAIDYDDMLRLIYFAKLPSELKEQNLHLLHNISTEALEALCKAGSSIRQGLYTAMATNRCKRVLDTWMLDRNCKIYKNAPQPEIDEAERDCDLLKKQIFSLKATNDGAGSQEILDWLEQYR